MKILGIVLLLLGLFKLLIVENLQKDHFQEYTDSLSAEFRDMLKCLPGALLADGLISIFCGLFIVLF